MKVLIDANIILDVLEKRQPHFEASAAVWKLCETEQIEGFISALSFANLVYVLRKELSAGDIEDVLTKLGLIFDFTALEVSDIQKAAELRWKDFEDAIQSVSAERIKADYIITRNVRDYKESRIPAFTPEEFLARY